MCGICGIFDTKNRIVDEKIITRMRDIMFSRGPDDAGIYVSNHIGLGHRRLKIIDLSSNARQPMSNKDESIWLVFNGEIYNYRELHDELVSSGHIFKSKSDTEVIIHGYEQWGMDVLTRLDGMFAFALWNSNKEELVLVRDRIGVKPLFYSTVNGKVYFASDIKSIKEVLSHELTINHKAIDSYLRFKWIPQDLTIYDQVKKVLPAHYIVFDKSSVKSNQYWRLDFNRKLHYKNESDYIDHVIELLNLAVKKRMLSDVPLGAFLSGGIDSSLVVAFLSNNSSIPVKTFSVAFDDESFNEAHYASRVSKIFHTEHNELPANMAIPEILPKIVWAFGEPFADASQIPTYYLSKKVREHVTVALSGDGGDECFGGYDDVKIVKAASIYRNILPITLRNKMFPFFSKWLMNRFRNKAVVHKFHTLTEYGRQSFIDSLTLSSTFNLTDYAKLYTPWFKEQIADHNPYHIYSDLLLSENTIDDIDKALYIDIMTQLPDGYLVKVDVASMINSLEVRSPFLDYKMMEYAASIPSNIKVKYGIQKHLLKKVAERYLPREIIYRRKMGFGFNLALMLRTNLKSFVKDILLSSRFKQRGYFNYQWVESMLEEHFNGIRNHTNAIWSLLCLELWNLIFVDKVLRIDSPTEKTAGKGFP